MRRGVVIDLEEDGSGGEVDDDDDIESILYRYPSIGSTR